MATAKMAKTIEHIHTLDSWARNLSQGALMAEGAGKPMPGFTVTEHADCMQICVDTPLGRICVCV
jgi:hypothetical protein